MPNLSSMFATCNAKSQYSRDAGEIYSALSEAGFYVYSKALKEQSNFFLKFDASTLVLQPNTQTYYLPPDCTQIINIAERKSASGKWLQMQPESVADALDNTRDCVGWYDIWDDNYGESRFSFAGPFLQAADTTNAPTGFGQAGYNIGGYRGTGFQTQSILVSPVPTENHFVEIAYVAKWIPIVNDKSYVMLPEELTYAMQAFAIAELLRSNNDSNALAYDAKGQTHLNAGLSWVRSRQIVRNPQIVPYLG
jgi:hypothetical protein